MKLIYYSVLIFLWLVSNKPNTGICFCFPDIKLSSEAFISQEVLIDLQNSMYKSGLYLVKYISHSQSLQNLILTFQVVFKNLCCPLVFYNVLLPLSLKCFLPFLHRGLSKFQRCHFFLFQTQQCDVNSKGGYSNLILISKGNYFKYFKNI